MKQRIFNALRFHGFTDHMSKIIVAQSAHETATLGAPWTSPIFLENNNPFGMKVALIRPTTVTGENRGHGVFQSIESAVQDYAYYWRYTGLMTSYNSVESFCSALKNKRYFEADLASYTKGVNHFYKQLWQ